MYRDHEPPDLTMALKWVAEVKLLLKRAITLSYILISLKVENNV